MCVLRNHPTQLGGPASLKSVGLPGSLGIQNNVAGVRILEVSRLQTQVGLQCCRCENFLFRNLSRYSEGLELTE